MAQTVGQVVDLIESVKSDEEVAGIVARYADKLTGEDGAKLLVKRLDERREAFNRWKALRATIDHLRMRQSAGVRHQLEAATQAVVAAEGLEALAKVAKEHPVVFTGTFLSSLMELHKAALAADETYTAEMVQNRLGHLQAIQLGGLGQVELTQEGLRTLVYQVLEARNFGDLLGLIAQDPIVLSSSFESIMETVGQEGAKQGQPSLPKVVALRLAVTRGVQRVVERIVSKRAADGGADEAVAAFGEAKDAEQFLAVVARFPFVLGEDFGMALDREIHNAKIDGQKDAVAGIERRKSHLGKIGDVVTKLTGEAQ